MKTKIVDSQDISAEKGLRAQDYISDLEDVSELSWGGLAEVAEVCFKTARSKGWWNEYHIGRGPRSIRLTPDQIAAKLCLIHSEVSEALEEVRGKRPITETGGSASLRGDKPKGFASELADIVIRVFDLAGGLGIDIAEAIRIKMAYNESRPFRHGGKKL